MAELSRHLPQQPLPERCHLRPLRRLGRMHEPIGLVRGDLHRRQPHEAAVPQRLAGQRFRPPARCPGRRSLRPGRDCRRRKQPPRRASIAARSWRATGPVPLVAFVDECQRAAPRRGVGGAASRKRRAADREHGCGHQPCRGETARAAAMADRCVDLLAGEIGQDRSRGQAQIDLHMRRWREPPEPEHQPARGEGGSTLIVSVPARSPPRARSTARPIRANASVRATSSSAPTALGVIPRPARRNSSTPSSASSARI